MGLNMEKDMWFFGVLHFDHKEMSQLEKAERMTQNAV